MSALIREHASSASSSVRRVLMLGALASISLCAFLLVPGEIGHKAHAILHGLCAQRPSHSIWIGGSPLPLDARMTGIYLGAAATGIWLLAAQRLRARATPSASVLAIFATCVAAMIIDGSNALLFDLQAPILYEPSNVWRLITGVLAGTSLGAAIAYVFAITIWKPGQAQGSIVMHPTELAWPVGAALALGVFAMNGPSSLFAPVAVGLVIAALFVFTGLSVVLLALVSGSAWRYERFADLAGIGVAASIVAMAIIGGLAALRFALEHTVGLPQLT